MPIFAAGTLNITSLIVPDLYVQIVPPSTLVLNGVPSNMVGLVGTATWGPVNTPVTVSSMNDFSFKFGLIQNRQYDLGTHAAIVTQQGGNSMMCVRVTDGTEANATAVVGSTNLTFTAKYPGTQGNSVVVSLQPGSQASTYRAIVGVPGFVPEIFDNIASPSTQTTTGSITSTTHTVNGATTSSTTVVLNSNTGVNVGDKVTGTGISGSPTVASVNVDGVTITLSSTQTLSNGVTLTFQPSSSTSITVASGTGIVTGMTITGTGVPSSTTVSAVSGTTVTASQAVTIANNASLTFTPSYHATWVALAAAINQGQNIKRGPSQWITAAAGSGTTAPTTTQYTLSGGLDGVGSVADATLVGNSASNTGMYALGGSGLSILDVCDVTGTSQMTVIDAFAMQQSAYAIQAVAAGTSVANSVIAKQTAGLDSYTSKLMHGDWLFWADPQNQVTRLVSPQAFVAGRLSNMSAEQSTLNKPIVGIAGSQKSGLGSLNAFYSQADLITLELAGIDVITNPGAGNLPEWTCRFGHNSSTNITVHVDNYTTLTNYIGKTLAAGLGYYLGRPITKLLFNDITATLTQFMQNLTGAGLLSTPDGALPYSVVCSVANNPKSQTNLGIVQADVIAVYPSIAEKFLVNLQGGNTVTVSHAPIQNQ